MNDALNPAGFKRVKCTKFSQFERGNSLKSGHDWEPAIKRAAVA